MRVLYDTAGVSAQSDALEIKLTSVTAALLAFLILQRQHSHRREFLAGLFWGEYTEEKARRCLCTALWRLRHALETEGVGNALYFVATSQGDIGFNQASDYWLDIEVFEREASQVLAKSASSLQEADVQNLKNALQVYTRDLLEGLSDDWALRERERLRKLYLNCLGHLMNSCWSRKVYAEGLEYGQRILDTDPLREEIHRAMMQMYADNGQIARVVQQYDMCRTDLARELGIAPMKETQALYARIVGSSDLSTAFSTDESRIACQNAHRKLSQAAKALDDARSQVQQAQQLLERLLSHN